MLKQRYMTIGKFQRYLSEFIERCAPAIECWPSAVWRIATPIGAGAIHPISFPATLSMVQRMLRQILLSALGCQRPNALTKFKIGADDCKGQLTALLCVTRAGLLSPKAYWTETGCNMS
ncbi:MAG: hypothetical protein P8P53_09925, partial [Tateyamaria sp.]|nr:hypothetical protein [Tateyamaria sp.]